MPDSDRSAPASLKPLFDPQTIAVIGASNNLQKFGGRPIHYMQRSGYGGRIYPINPRDAEIQGLKAYRDVRDVPEAIDMTVISVPAPGVVDAVEACAEAKVRSVVIFSSGFAEVGGDGERWQARLREIARSSGTRLVGPNCMGMLNTHSKAIGTFSSSFEQGWPKVGGISILSQSGAVGSHTMVLARERGLGIRGWITTGNEVDVDVADCLEYCAEDPDTEVIALYLEGCRQPDKLMRALETARRNRKPVVVLKVGASEVGTIAASTHTASLSGADEVFDAVFRQSGAHRARSLRELLEVAAAAQSGQLPEGRRLGLVTISGGAGVMMSDAAADHGLEVPALPAPAQRRLKELMPFAAVRNPVDTTAAMLNDVDLFRKMLLIMLDEGDCDAILLFLSLVGFNERMMTPLRKIFAEIREAYPDRLIVGSMCLREPDREALETLRYIMIEDANEAVAAIGVLAGFAEAFRRPAALAPPALPADLPAVPARPLREDEASAILAAAGLPMAPRRIASNRAEASAALAELGAPVAMKILSPDIQHKSEIGGVRLNLADAAAVEAAYAEMTARAAKDAPAARIDGVLLAPMVAGGLEAIVGSYRDSVFGPVVLVGLGGVLVEVLRDVAIRVAPFGIDVARAMIAELQGAAIFDGVRGAPPADIEALAETLARLSVFAHAHRDSVESIDINPLIVRPRGQGAVGVDALIVPRG